ncbi:MAG: domain S-box-containing protein [Verrucomicrobiales bacterium]|nr:domain S-box-containing protein [Verrucomicrobiales bacterium]
MPSDKKLEASLKEVSQLKAALDECAIVAITDPQGKISYVNDKFCAISKYTRAELLGQDHRIINSGYHPKEFIHDLWKTITHGRVWHGEIKNKAKDGTFYWVDTTIVPFLNEDGKPYQYLAIRADITERKRIEQRDIEHTAQLETANRDLEAFSYSVSHDLRAPLRGVDNFVRMLQEDCADRLDAEGNRMLNVVSSEAKRMGRLIDHLMSFSRLGRQQLESAVVDMNLLARAAFESVATSASHSGTAARFELNPLPPAHGDHSLLRQVFDNLIGNAVKYSARQPAPVVEVGGWNRDGELTYYVKDNGVGFDEKYRHKLFRIFQRLHSEEEFEGTGVGLAIVQRVIHRHGGKVLAESKLGQGATFYFTLPSRLHNL